MAPESKCVWNPYEALHVYLEARTITCVGHTQAKGHPRCRNPIAYPNIQAACSILDDMAIRTPSPELANQSLPTLVRLLLCKRNHQDQAEEKLLVWTKEIRFVAGYYQEMSTISPIKQLPDRVNIDRQEKKQLLLELAQCKEDLEKARQQSSRAMKATEHALKAKTDVDLRLQDVSQELKETKRSYKRSEARILQTSSANSDLRSLCTDLEDALGSQAKDLAAANESNGKLSQDLELIRDKLSPMLCDPMPSKTRSVMENTLLEPLDLAYVAREAFNVTKDKLLLAQEKLVDKEQSIKEKDAAYIALQQDVVSAREEADTTKQQLADRIETTLDDQTKASTQISDLQQLVRHLEKQQGEAHIQIEANNVSCQVYTIQQQKLTQPGNHQLSQTQIRYLRLVCQRFTPFRYSLNLFSGASSHAFDFSFLLRRLVSFWWASREGLRLSHSLRRCLSSWWALREGPCCLYTPFFPYSQRSSCMHAFLSCRSRCEFL